MSNPSGVGRRNILLALLATALIPQPALAYIDPGTGSLIFQFAAASLLGLLFMLKTYWLRIKIAVGKYWGGRGSGNE